MKLEEEEPCRRDICMRSLEQWFSRKAPRGPIYFLSLSLLFPLLLRKKGFLLSHRGRAGTRRGAKEEEEGKGHPREEERGKRENAIEHCTVPPRNSLLLLGLLLLP